MRKSQPMLVLLAGALALASCSPVRGDTSESSAGLVVATSLVDAPDQYFQSGDATIRYRVIGDGEPVVLLHGYTDRVEMWAGTGDSLARDYRVIVPDIRGHGLSTKFGDPAQYGRKTVDDVVRLLDHLDVSSAHVVGYSMGAVMAANLALDHPDRVRTVTFAAGAFYSDSAAIARAIEPHVLSLERGEGLGAFFRFILPTWTDSAINTLLPSLEAANDSASLVASIRGLYSLMLDSARLARGRAPAVSIVSVDDPMLGPSRFVARSWPGTRLVELQRGDHGDIFALPELVTEFRHLARTATQ